MSNIENVNTLKEDNSNEVSRRRVVQGAGALGLSAAFAGSAITMPLATAQSEEVKMGGELNFSVSSAPLYIDPAASGSATEYIILRACYNTLFRVNETLELELELVEDYEISDDGLVYTLKLRDGITFHHGKALTSEDVVYTFNRVMDEATASSGAPLFDTVASIEAPDDLTVVFTLSAPNADLLYHFGSTFKYIVPSDIDPAELNRMASGTGPFKLEVYQPGSQIEMVRNEDYWEDGLPYLDRVRLIQIPEQTGQSAALTGGQTHIFHDVTPQTADQLDQDDSVTVAEIDSPSFQPLSMRTDMEPWDKVEVRQAFKYSIDRDVIVQGVIQGRGSASNDHHVSPVSPFWVDTGLKTRDIEKAKELLAQAGYPDGIDVELYASNERPGLVELGTIVQQMAGEAGIRIELQIVPWDVFVADHMYTAGLQATNWFGRASIDETLYPYLKTGARWNVEKYSNAEVDDLLEEGREVTDPEARKEIYGRVQEIVAEDGAAIIAYHRAYITAYRNEVKGYQPHALRFVDLRTTWLDV